MTKSIAEKGLSPESIKKISANEKGQIILPRESGYYLILLSNQKGIETQSYYGVFGIK